MTDHSARVVDSALSLAALSSTTTTTTTSKAKRQHRAVAAAQQASQGCASPIISTHQQLQRPPKHIVRYASFNSLVTDRQVDDPWVALREELEGMKEKPPPRCELDDTSDDELMHIVKFLGYPDSVIFASTCRRLRHLVLSRCRESSVDIIPTMLSAEAFTASTESTDGAALTSIKHFFSTQKRGQHVTSLSLMASHHAATLPTSQALPVAHISHVLSLLSSFSYLSTLDARGVVWTAASTSTIAYFLSDLYLVAPQLQTLKVGVDLYDSWTPGWWQRLPELNCFVVASRREQPPPQLDVAPPAITLHADLFAMLQSDRQWKLKLWPVVEESSLRSLLFPTTTFACLTELSVNVFGSSAMQAPEAALDSSDGKGKGKVSRRPGTAEDGETLAFPRLTAVTVANVEENPVVAVELFGKLSLQAPRLASFAVCNTVRYIPPERVKGRRRPVKAAAAA